ncbi:tRNA (guanosine(37)-N1)-methyltransferase TrmD [Anaerotalea alkaliphila]|uniref:tRNA (guanine-N(1)-)-methyltransferase n=1 Tax=Anaerotalea alkaliphila TaxID=2662126 RepID=A0A7X5KPI7_9FIRM|nr:tRNA (guanosine(37)-N1)-methyltransferase TrmD [Anaerotalea alkaliphila]NDL68177.1 tRNA (guanosine(37)-N1)-methyltransferase TrmD [Anaerotalea alkaliphila]
MKFTVLTLFPEHVQAGLGASVIGKALERGILELSCINIRDFAGNKHNQVDDYPYGGGAGMVMQPGPILRAYESIQPRPKRVVYLTPQGKTFDQEMAFSLAREESLVFLCGHYEGVDERIIDRIVTDEVSIGDYILTGGEMAAMVMIDAIGRLVDGVLSNSSSYENESFHQGLLEYPQYTRPAAFEGQEVPEVLLSGHHGNIDRWRREQALVRTLRKRPDLLEKAELTEKDREFIRNYCKENGIVL